MGLGLGSSLPWQHGVGMGCDDHVWLTGGVCTSRLRVNARINVPRILPLTLPLTLALTWTLANLTYNCPCAESRMANEAL